MSRTRGWLQIAALARSLMRQYSPSIRRRVSSLTHRHRDYSDFMTKIKPVRIHEMPLESDITKEPAYEEYHDLLRHHPAAQRTERTLHVAINFALQFDKFMRVGNVYTMCERTQMLNLIHCVSEVLREEVPGDLFEAGCWRGGMGMLMKEVLRRNQETTRTVWLADAWSGRFPPSEVPSDAEIEDFLNRLFQDGPSRDEVIENFRVMDLLDSGVEFVGGYFEESLPSVPVDRIAVLRLDADLYNSTMDALTYLYPKLSSGGYLILDDYGIPFCDCKKAVTDYRRSHDITEPIEMADNQCAYWKKS